MIARYSQYRRRATSELSDKLKAHLKKMMSDKIKSCKNSSNVQIFESGESDETSLAGIVSKMYDAYITPYSLSNLLELIKNMNNETDANVQFALLTVINHILTDRVGLSQAESDSVKSLKEVGGDVITDEGQVLLESLRLLENGIVVNTKDDTSTSTTTMTLNDLSFSVNDTGFNMESTDVRNYNEEIERLSIGYALEQASITLNEQDKSLLVAKANDSLDDVITRHTNILCASDETMSFTFKGNNYQSGMALSHVGFKFSNRIFKYSS